MSRITVPERVRVSYGSAIVLELIEGMSIVNPTTVYLLTFYSGRCTANCAFCPQARGSVGKLDHLSRVTWPDFETEDVVERLVKSQVRNQVQRVCVQSLNYKKVYDDVAGLVSLLSGRLEVPISVSTKPLTANQLERLRAFGVDRVSIPLDCATDKIFRLVKGSGVGGPYSWETHWRGLETALEIFGRGKVSTHVIVGLGETDEDLADILQRLVDLDVFPGLFAFTPIPGTCMESRSRPSISRYRRIQILHYILTRKIAHRTDLTFTRDGEVIDFGLSRERLRETIRSGVPFVTSGCPGCNRPFYNERPSGPIYNYPRPLKKEEINRIEEVLLGNVS